MPKEDVVDVQFEEIVSVEEVPAEEAELLPGPVSDGTMVESWKGEVRNAALAAASGLVVGVAAVAAAKAAGVAIQHRLAQPRQVRRLERPRGTVATRTYIVDVHLVAPGRGPSR